MANRELTSECLRCKNFRNENNQSPLHPAYCEYKGKIVDPFNPSCDLYELGETDYDPTEEDLARFQEKLKYQ